MNDDDDDDEDDKNGNIGGANEENVASNMILDAPESQSNLNPVDDCGPKVVTQEAEDGWVQVPHRRNRGKKN